MAKISEIKGKLINIEREEIINVTLLLRVYLPVRYTTTWKRPDNFRSRDRSLSSCRGRDYDAQSLHSLCHTRTRYDGGHARVACATAYERSHARETIRRVQSGHKFILRRDEGDERTRKREEDEGEEEGVKGERVEARRRRRFSAVRVNGESAT